MIDAAFEHVTIIKTILSKYIPGVEVWAFGSRVRGQAKPYSDLDLVIVGEKKVKREVMMELKEAFAESDLPFRVDVLDWQGISSEFQKIIARNYVVIQM